jgi:hypothetical protein
MVLPVRSKRKKDRRTILVGFLSFALELCLKVESHNGAKHQQEPSQA